MPTTINSISKNAIGAEIVQIILDSTTGNTLPITIGADSMHSVEFTYETLGAAVSNAEQGNPVAVNVALTFILIGLGKTTDWTSINEINTSGIAFVELKLMSGQTITLNSGEDDVSIMYFNDNTPTGENAFGVQLSGQRKIPYSALTIT